jgi:hypothetical protein
VKPSVARLFFHPRPGGILTLFLLFAGCGGPFLSTYDNVALGKVFLTNPKVEEDGFRPAFQCRLGELLAANGSLPLLQRVNERSDRTLVVETCLDPRDRPKLLGVSLASSRGAPLLDAVLSLPQDSRPLPKRAAGSLANYLGSLAPAKEEGDPTDVRTPLVCIRGAPGRFLLSAYLAALPVGSQSAGSGAGAPDYNEIFGMGRGAGVGLALGVNGFLDAVAQGGYSTFEGDVHRSCGMTWRFADLSMWDVRVGLRARLPLVSADPLPRLLRSFPPFPDTRGVWLTFRFEGGMALTDDVEAVLLGGCDGYPVLPAGTVLRYFRKGVRFEAEAAAGIELRSWVLGGALISLSFEAGISVGQPLPEGVGRAAEGSEFVLFPLRFSCAVSF